MCSWVLRETLAPSLNKTSRSYHFWLRVEFDQRFERVALGKASASFRKDLNRVRMLSGSSMDSQNLDHITSDTINQRFEFASDSY